MESNTNKVIGGILALIVVVGGGWLLLRDDDTPGIPNTGIEDNTATSSSFDASDDLFLDPDSGTSTPGSSSETDESKG